MMWQTIDTAPKTSKAILVHCAERKNTYTVTWMRDEEFPWSGEWKHFSGDFLNEAPSHWMPLPAPPLPHNAELCGGTSATNAVLNGKT